MLRVLGLVSFKIFPAEMGGQKGVAKFYQYLSHQAEVMLATPAINGDEPGITQFKIVSPNKKIYKNLFRLNDLKKIIREKNVDIVIAEHSYTGWIAQRLSRATGIPFIIHSHNIESHRFREMQAWWWRLYLNYEAKIHRKAHHNFFISEEDRHYALQQFRLKPEKCSVITYGVEQKPVLTERKSARSSLGIEEKKPVFLFNGTLDYKPNYEAVIMLIEKITPLLNKKLDSYQVIITGNRMPAELQKKIKTQPNLVYAGYVGDIDLYYRAADVFLNPVSNDTGVKTKLIEAVGNHCTSVSTRSGASGIRKEVCGDKLICVEDGDWNSFAEEIVEAFGNPRLNTPSAFYDYYSWKNIAAKAFEKMSELVNQ
jgi:glycosyltransferase involved in cell wall biosynthesis